MFLCLDNDNTYFQLSMKYFDPEDILLSVFFHIKRFDRKGNMWELRYVSLGLREMAALLRFNRDYKTSKRERAVKREKPTASVQPQPRKILPKVQETPDDEDVIVPPSDEENY